MVLYPQKRETFPDDKSANTWKFLQITIIQINFIHQPHSYNHHHHHSSQRSSPRLVHSPALPQYTSGTACTREANLSSQIRSNARSLGPTCSTASDLITRTMKRAAATPPQHISSPGVSRVVVVVVVVGSPRGATILPDTRAYTPDIYASLAETGCDSAVCMCASARGGIERERRPLWISIHICVRARIKARGGRVIFSLPLNAWNNKHKGECVCARRCGRESSLKWLAICVCVYICVNGFEWN